MNITKEEVDQAYRLWMFNANVDRGYNHSDSWASEQQFYNIKELYEQQTGEKYVYGEKT